MALISAFVLVLASALPVMTTVQYVDSSPRGWCSADIRYPRLTGLPSAPLEHRINVALRERFFAFPSPYLGGVSFTPSTHPSLDRCERDMVDEAKFIPPTYLPHGHAASLARTTFRIGYIGARFVSIVGDGFQYGTGAAHPNDFWWTLDIDTSSGNLMKFDDLFYADANHRERLHRLIETNVSKLPYSSEYELVESFDGERFPGDLQPLVCSGGVRFFDLFDVHVVAAVTTFVSGKDLIAAGVVKDPVALAVLKQPRRSNDTCGLFY